MRAAAVTLTLMLLAPGLAAADAGDCLAVWVEPEQPAECKPLGMDTELDHQPDVCRAPSAKKAAVRLKLTSCREQPQAVSPGTTPAGHEYVVRAQVTEGQVTTELSASDEGSWSGAIRRLCRAVVVWHGQRAGSH